MGSTASARHLIVTDAGNHAVHVVDVVHGEHVGYVAAPGMLSKPRGVAARGSKVAVSKYAELRLYEGAGATWTLTHAVRHAGSPFGLRFTADGTGLAVTDFCYGRVSVFCVEDLSFVRHLATGLSNPVDVEECEGGGWTVALFDSTALANLPGLGFLVRDNDKVQVFATVDAIAMLAMSVMKTPWIATVLRGAIGRL